MSRGEGPTYWELARQALSSTQRGYDLLAPKFDVTPFRSPQALLDAAAPYVGAHDRALDLCCGTGAVMEMLGPLNRERLVGVDFSHSMLEVARHRMAARLSGASWELVRADVLEMPFENAFDVVTCFSAIGHIPRPDQPRLIRQVAQVLRPGGRFVIESAERPALWAWPLWFSLGFNTAMAVRNVIRRPPFHMYYMSFLLPRARQLLEKGGFDVEAHEGFCARFPRLRLMVATLKRHGPVLGKSRPYRKLPVLPCATLTYRLAAAKIRRLHERHRRPSESRLRPRH